MCSMANIQAQDSYTNGKFDIKKFNANFAEEKYARKNKNLELDNEILQQINNTAQNQNDNNLLNIFSGIGNTYLGIMNDTLDGNISIDMFIINDRIYFIGICIVVLTLILCSIFAFVNK